MLISRLEEYQFYVPTVAEWIYNEWGRKLPGGSISRAKRILKIKPDTTGLPAAFIAVRNSGPVGIARLAKYDMSTRKELGPWLTSVYVPAQHRNCGIGTALCKMVISEAHKLGFSKLFILTPNREAFYIRQGWKVIEHTVYRNEKVAVMQIKPSGPDA